MAWIFFNPNPVGKSVRDCTVRAICAAEGMPWMDAYFLLCIQGAEVCDMPDSNEAFRRLLRKWRYSRHNIPNTCPDCYTIADFCRDNMKGCYIVGTGDHVVTVRDGNYYDTGDSGNEVPLYFYKKEN